MQQEFVKSLNQQQLNKLYLIVKNPDRIRGLLVATNSEYHSRSLKKSFVNKTPPKKEE